MKNIFRTLCIGLCMMLASLVFAPFAPAYAEEARYCDSLYNNSGTTTVYTETLSYSSYTNPILEFTYLEVPPYSFLTGSNTCAPTAGGVVVGYYDYYKPNLIENWSTYHDVDGYPTAYPANDIVRAAMAEMYTYMGTNVGGDGTTQSGFWSGLNTYVTQQGYTLQYSDAGSGTTMITNMRNAFAQDKIVVLFVSSFKYIQYGGFNVGDTSYSMLVRENPAAGHVCVASGYREYYFYQGSTQIAFKRYLEISYGNGSTGLLEINDLTTIDNAYSCYIY